MKEIMVVCMLLIVGDLSAQQTVGVFQNDSLAVSGYTLLAPNNSRFTWLIDNCGFVVNQWESEYTPGLSAYLLENGNLMRAARISSMFNGGGTGGRIEIFNWEGDLIWSYNHSTEDYHHHHDMELMPNGNILLIAWEKHEGTDAIANGRNPLSVGSQGIWAEQIVEIEPIGTDEVNVIWEWHLWDHLVQDFDDSKPNFGAISDYPERMDINFGGLGADWIHFNAIDYNAELDQIALSSRHLSEIWIIDHSTTTAEAATNLGGNAGKGGDILYRWGNPQIYGRGTENDQKLFGQHNVEWIPEGFPDEGQLIVFNNGQNRPDGNYSTVDVWEPPVDMDGNYVLEDSMAYGPTELSWTFVDSPNNLLYSSNISGAQRLSNGNTLICEGRSGHIFEVDYDGNYVWDYISPVVNNGIVVQGNNVNNNSVFRALRYADDYAAFDNVDLIPLEPIELEPIDYGCQIFSDSLPNSTSFAPLEGVRVVGNPIDNQLVIENKTNEPVFYSLIDLTGKQLIYNQSAQILILENTSNLPVGIYILQLTNIDRNKFFNEKIVVIE